MSGSSETGDRYSCTVTVSRQMVEQGPKGSFRTLLYRLREDITRMAGHRLKVKFTTTRDENENIVVAATALDLLLTHDPCMTEEYGNG